MNKSLIAERFAKARDTYSKEARVQQQVAEKMMRLLAAHTPLQQFRRIVEFGCGTGSYSRLLQHQLQPESLLLNDLCPEMEELLTDLCPHARFLPGDAEMLDFPIRTDLITSCSTVQWFNDPGAFFSRCPLFLHTGGYLAFSTFGSMNLHEINRLTGNGLDYIPLEKLSALLAPHFEVVHAEEEIIALPFAQPLQVLQHLKQTGVTGTEKKMWTRGKLQTFCEEYSQQFSQSDGNVTLTYHPIYLIGRKKEF